ncbi:MAG: Asp-tRNA(Asn)/Glu-tRNA(Gln) amidotransferase subunit GatA [Rhodothermales bacterium]|nr:Asp-tRNA(Asn)/Glu-tRNA(Gln) amidotransferase subunit GatA [Rhodothermales bacterium]
MNRSTFVDDRRRLLAGETSCEQLVSSYLDVVGEKNDDLNALLSVSGEQAVHAARTVDSRFAAAESLPMAGAVVAVKDVLCIEGDPVTCGSHILEGFRSLYTATSVQRLQEAGAVVIGKANCDEFAMGSSNENSYFGPVRNPVAPDRVPGGSSGGSAAAVAAGMCNLALGSDTGGSIRQPAAFCGVVGLKPTYGRISRYGLVAYASSLDSVGPMANSVEDVAAALTVMAGVDTSDSTSAPVDVPDFAPAVTRGVEGLRVGVPSEFMGEGLDPEIRARLEEQLGVLESGGALIREVTLPHTSYGIAAYYVLATAEASSNLARYDGVRYGYRSAKNPTDGRESSFDLAAMYSRSRTEGFGAEVKRRIMLGTYVLSSGYYDAYYARAQRVRALIRRDFDSAFEQVDVLLTPATPTPAFELGSKAHDPLEMYLSDIFTVTANLAGIPGLVVPAGLHSSGLPIGLQFLGRHFDEASILAAGHFLMDRVHSSSV